MATVKKTRQAIQGGIEAHWTIQAGDDGEPMGDSYCHRRSVQVSGTFGDSEVTIEGSNGDDVWATLVDIAGDPLVFSAAGVKTVQGFTKLMRPAANGTTGADLKISVIALC